MLVRKISAAFAAFAIAAAVVVVVDAPASAATMSAKTMLSKLTVTAESASGSYARSKFTHWIDANGDCQNARAEVLIAESKSKVTFTSSSKCTVKTGKWVSWYDGKTWTKASDVDIDHMVPLKEAWESGASKWNAATRKAYANDLKFGGTLVAVTDNVNQSKGARDPGEWLPSQKVCKYAQNWVQVKYRWKLSIDSAEKKKLASILTGSCGSKQIFVPARATIKTGSSSTGSGSGGSTGSSGTDPRFSYCYQAIDAGYGPYYKGRDEEYYWYTDGDGDGIVCE